MALSLAQKDALTTNDSFLARVRQSVRQHAVYLIALPGNATQLDWANLMVGPNNRAGQAAADLAGRLVCDSAVADSTTGDASDVTDTALQTAVDTICEEYRGS